MACGIEDGTTVAAHSPMRHIHGGGMGMKVDDCFVAYLCSTCHDLVDGRRGDYDKARRDDLWMQAHIETVRYWFREALL